MKISSREMELAMARSCLSTKELAQKAGCSTRLIHLMLKGERNTTTKKLGEIAKALDVDPADLVE